MKLTASATAKVRASLAVQFIFTAAKFSRRVKEIEQANINTAFGEFFEDIISYASGAILTSAASLEAYVNEIFVDREQHFPGYNRQLIDDIWEKVEKDSILDKYAMISSLKSAGRFNKGDAFYQNAADLIRLRNTLMHFKPAWSDEEGEHKRLMERLKNKFDTSPFFQNSIAAFPNSIMSYSCAKWSVNATVSFIAKFSEVSQMENKLKKFEDRLKLD